MRKRQTKKKQRIRRALYYVDNADENELQWLDALQTIDVKPNMISAVEGSSDSTSDLLERRFPCDSDPAASSSPEEPPAELIATANETEEQ